MILLAFTKYSKILTTVVFSELFIKLKIYI